MRKVLLLLLKICISGLLLYLALRNVDFSSLKARLSETDPRWFGLGLIIIVLQIVLLALRWRAIAHRCGSSLTAGHAIRFCMIGMFFNQTLPSSVGGDAIRIWLLGRQKNWRTATYSVVLDRVVGVVALADLVLICLPWSLGIITDPYARAALLLAGLGINVAALVFFGLALEPLRVLDRWTVFRHLGSAAMIALTTVRSLKAVATIFGLSFGIHLLSALVAWSIARSVGADIPLQMLLIVVPPALLATVIPVSIAGWGVRESAMVASFAYAGLSQNDGLVVSLLFGAQYLLIGLACGIIWIMPNAGGRADYGSATAPNK